MTPPCFHLGESCLIMKFPRQSLLRVTTNDAPRPGRTRIDELLCISLPALFLLYLLFYLCDLFDAIIRLESPTDTPVEGCFAPQPNAWTLTVSDGSASMMNFCCFRSYQTKQYQLMSGLCSPSRNDAHFEG